MRIQPAQDRIKEAAHLLGTMGNEHRLMILCELVGGERRVRDLAGSIGLSQSALSQHLAKLRRAHVVHARRASRAIFYSLANPAAEQVIAALGKAFDPPCHGKRSPSHVD